VNSNWTGRFPRTSEEACGVSYTAAEFEEEAITPFDKIWTILVWFFFTLGVVSFCVIVGLLHAGFFHWLAKTMPNSIFATLFGGGL